MAPASAALFADARANPLPSDRLAERPAAPALDATSEDPAASVEPPARADACALAPVHASPADIIAANQRPAGGQLRTRNQRRARPRRDAAT